MMFVCQLFSLIRTATVTSRVFTLFSVAALGYILDMSRAWGQKARLHKFAS